MPLFLPSRSNHSHGNPTLALTNLSGTTASASSGLTLSLSAGAGGADGGNILAADTRTAGSNSTVLFSNANGVSFGLNAVNGSVMTATVKTDYLTTAALSNHSHGDPTLALTNLSGTTASNSAGLTLSLSAANPGAGGGIAAAAGTQTATSGTVVFSNANNFTFGMSNSSVVTASYTSPVIGATPLDVSVVTASGTNTSQFAAIDHAHRGVFRVQGSGNPLDGPNDITMYGSVGIHAGNNISISSSGTNNSHGTIFIHAAAPGGGGAATISSWPLFEDAGVFNTAILHTGASGATGGSTQFTGSIRLYSLPFPFQLELNDIVMQVSAQATSAGTGSATCAVMLGLYTLNGNSALSLHKSYVWGMQMSQSSVTARTHRQWWGTDSGANTTTAAGNLSASFSGLRNILLNGTADSFTAKPGGYYAGVMVTQRSSSVNVYGLASMLHATGSQTSWGSFMGQSTFAPGGFQGIVSTTTNTNVIFPGLLMPASIHTSAITNSGGTTQHLDPYFIAYRKST